MLNQFELKLILKDIETEKKTALELDNVNRIIELISLELIIYKQLTGLLELESLKKAG